MGLKVELINLHHKTLFFDGEVVKNIMNILEKIDAGTPGEVPQLTEMGLCAASASISDSFGRWDARIAGAVSINCRGAAVPEPSKQILRRTSNKGPQLHCRPLG